MPKLAALASAADNICCASSSVRLVYVRGISPHLNMDRIFKRPCADRKFKRLFHAAPPAPPALAGPAAPQALAAGDWPPCANPSRPAQAMQLCSSSLLHSAPPLKEAPVSTSSLSRCVVWGRWVPKRSRSIRFARLQRRVHRNAKARDRTRCFSRRLQEREGQKQ